MNTQLLLNPVVPRSYMEHLSTFKLTGKRTNSITALAAAFSQIALKSTVHYLPTTKQQTKVSG